MIDGLNNKAKVECFQQFFNLIGKELAEKVEFVCPDMWKPNLQLITQHCTNALNIPDQFYIVAKLNLPPDEAGPPRLGTRAQDRYEPVLKNLLTQVRLPESQPSPLPGA